MTTRIEVDFNARDETGHVPAALSEADGPVRVGEYIDLYDDDGYRCLALVSEVAGERVAASPLWQTFTSESESRLLPVRGPQWRIVNRLSVVFGTEQLERQEFIPTGSAHPVTT